MEVKTPAVGQIWADCDWRAKGRHVRIISLDETHAVTQLCDGNGRSLTHRVSRIRKDRLKPGSTGYRFVGEV